MRKDKIGRCTWLLGLALVLGFALTIGTWLVAYWYFSARIAALNEAGVGLWDTIASAIRPGSLDADIRDMAARDLAAFVADLPSLRAVGFNGGTSARIGRRQLAGTPLALIDLPSSSAAHAGLTLVAKQERWLALREYLR